MNVSILNPKDKKDALLNTFQKIKDKICSNISIPSTMAISTPIFAKFYFFFNF